MRKVTRNSQREAQDMVYRGHVVSGMIQLDEAIILPDGAEVHVEVATTRQDFDPSTPTIEEKLRAIVADVPKEEWDRLPADLSENLDHYVYGTPR
jgi:hypothetical protein